MVDSNGNIVASTPATEPYRVSEDMPWTSASKTKLYYLTAGGEVRFLAADGTTGVTTHIALLASEQAGFAVSPDDSRIAVALLKYSAPGANSGPVYQGMRMYVEDLSGGGHHVDIFSSAVVAEYPIAWTGGRLIIALSSAACCPIGMPNPVGAFEYHVVDPATGIRLLTLCDRRTTAGPNGPPTTVGVDCGRLFFRWDGTPLGSPGTAVDGALSPDGSQDAIGAPAPTGIEISGPGAAFLVTGVLGDVAGWLDTSHLVYRLRSDSDFYIADEGDIQAGPQSKVPLNGPDTRYQGPFPTLIS